MGLVMVTLFSLWCSVTTLENRNRRSLIIAGSAVFHLVFQFRCKIILQELDVVTRMIQQMVNENATQAADQVDYTNRYNALVERYESLENQHGTLQAQKDRRLMQAAAIDKCLTALEEVDLLNITFSEALWNAAVDHMTVYAENQLVFHFKNGSNIPIQM